MPRFTTSLLIGICAAFASGCSSGPATFELSGTVTFNGQPVPAGRIDFFPDFAQGNDGPQGYAFIKDGAFDTRKGGKGHAGGPMVVKIEGFDGKTDNPAHFGVPIFPVYELNRELPRGSGQ